MSNPCYALPVCLLLMLSVASGFCEKVILQLKNGDRITGDVVSQSSERIVLSTPWAKNLSIPLAEVAERKMVEVPPLPETTAQAQAEPAVITNVVATAEKVSPPAKQPPKIAQKKSWHGKVDLGTDLGFSEVSRELYYARAKINYVPEKLPGDITIASRFRNAFDYQATYGKTDGTVSANRMDSSSKTDFDLGKRSFVYNLVGIGYDEVRRINFQYEVGPGYGYRVITRTNLALNTEIGMSYQVQELERVVGGVKTSDTNERFFVRLAEDATWTISKKLSLDEKLELFPSLEGFEAFRLRFETNLRYALWQSPAGQNVSLVLTVMDTYDTQPARDVNSNDLQIRSAIGISF